MYIDRVELTGIVDEITHRSRWHRVVYNFTLRQACGDDSRCIPLRMFGEQGRRFAEQAPPGTPVSVTAHLDAFEWERAGVKRWLTNIVCEPGELNEDDFAVLPPDSFPEAEVGPASFARKQDEIPF
jgi:single-stranded DNA-binding protein